MKGQIMKDFWKQAALALLLTGCTAPAIAEEPRDIAIITVATPREANLLQLRGLAGRGTALLRQNGQCHKLPIRFVAGDFAGQRVDVGRATPIQMVITAPQVVAQLLAGRDLVSDMVQPGDITRVSGLPEDTGFVINPGRTLLSDILRARPRTFPCAQLSKTEQALPAHLK